MGEKEKTTEHEIGQDLITGEPCQDVEEVKAEPYPTFEDFWEAYDKKRGKPKTLQKWRTLSQKDKEAIMAYIPAYKDAQPDKQFRKDPATFLNQKSWNDEIIKSNGKIRDNNQEPATLEKIATLARKHWGKN